MAQAARRSRADKQDGAWLCKLVTVQAAVPAIFYVFETQIFIGSTLFLPFNALAAAILYTLLAVWMIIANLDSRSDG